MSSCAGADSTTPRRQENQQQGQQEQAAAGAALSFPVTSDVTTYEDLQNLSNPAAAAATASPPAAAQLALVNAAGAPSERVEGPKAQDTSLSSSLSSSPLDIAAAVQDAEISSRPEQQFDGAPRGV